MSRVPADASSRENSVESIRTGVKIPAFEFHPTATYSPKIGIARSPARVRDRFRLDLGKAMTSKTRLAPRLTKARRRLLRTIPSNGTSAMAANHQRLGERQKSQPTRQMRNAVTNS